MKSIIITGALCALTSVMLGALATHGLDGVLSASSLQSFKTGVQYQMFHSLAILAVAALPQLHKKLAMYTCLCFIAGVVMFSGSIYMLSLFGMSWLGPVTPLGGLTLMIGWLLLVAATIKGARHG